MPKRQPHSREEVGPTPRKMRNWVLISYDIPDDRRRTKVMKTLSGYGRRVQYSVFECELRPADLENLKVRLRQLIHADADDVRFYQLCEACLGKTTMLGKAELHRHAPYSVV